MTTARVGESSSSVVAAGAALAMAAVAALLLAVADAIWVGVPTSDGPGLSLLYIGGWVLMAWAAIVAIGVALRLGRSIVARRPHSTLEIVLLVAAAALIAAVLLAQPLAGSGEA